MSDPITQANHRAFGGWYQLGLDCGWLHDEGLTEEGRRLLIELCGLKAPCETCGGTGEVVNPKTVGDLIVPCPACTKKGG